MGKLYLDPVVAADNVAAFLVIHESQLFKNSWHIIPELVVWAWGLQLGKVTAHAAYALWYAHIIVIQDNEQVIVGYGCVVYAFKSQSAAHCAVTNHGNYTAWGMSVAFVGHSHTKCCRYGIGCVSCGKSVVFTFCGWREWTKTSQFAVGAESVTTAGKNLVAVCLMTDIPYNAVIGGVKDVM